MKMKNLTISMILWLLLLGGQFALAQGGGGSQTALRGELERTDELIERVGDAVRASNSAVGDQVLTQAKKVQGQAWTEFRGNRYGVALTATRRARELAATALTNSRNAEQLEGVVLRKLEQTGEILERVRDLSSGVENDAFNSMFDNAKGNLARAWEFYRGQQYRTSLQLADQVEKAGDKLINLARQQDRSETEFERRREYVERLLAQAQEAVADCDSETARLVLSQAENSFETALQMQSQRHFQAGLQALRLVRQNALKAAGECQDKDRLQARYEVLRNDIDHLAEQLRDRSGENAEAAGKLVRRAYEQLDLTREHLSNNEVEP
ncbi:MAG: hypothetical protein GY867_06935, partial [bacterium]|nr:hypothetical protein [bacterium]